MKTLKERLKRNEVTIGSWLQIGHPVTAEIMAQKDFDWLAIDLEHSVIDLSCLQVLMQIIQSYNITPLVRLSSNDAVQIKRVMDAGASGIIVPNVNSSEDARRAVAFAKYPPQGQRGVGLARAQGYGLEFEKYKRWINKGSIVIVQIEHRDAINNLEEILSVEGIDASIIGPYDLSASLGIPGEFEKKEVKEAVKTYVRACKDIGKPAGYHVIEPESRKVMMKIKEGFSFLGFSMDTLFLGLSVRSSLKGIRRIR